MASPAAAQQKEPIGRFVADLRGIFARHKTEPEIAKGIDVTGPNLPIRSIGLAGGAHVYLWRIGRVRLGVGVEGVFARGTRTLDLAAADGKTTTKGPTVRRHFTSIAPEVSLNSGGRNGWSYVSGGMFGRAKLYADRLDSPAKAPPMRKSLHYGGGARWFINERIAFSVDVRWYSIVEQPPPAVVFLPLILQPKTTLMLLSSGISIK